MALVSVETRTIEQVVEVKEETFILTLTEDEAKELLAVTGALAPYGRGSDKGPTVTSDVYSALSSEFHERGYNYSNRRRIRMDGTKPTWC